MIAVPNIISANAFSVQASAREGRVTWMRINGKDVPGVIVKAKPSLRFPGDVLFEVGQISDEIAEMMAESAPDLAAIDAAATQDDVLAWAYAARWWINYAWQMFDDSTSDVWKQTEEFGVVDLSTLLPGARSLSNNVTFGCLEAIPGAPFLATSSWNLYFASLAAQVVLKSTQGRVSTLIGIQIAMRSVAWWMSSAIIGDSVEFTPVHPCKVAMAWRQAPAAKCGG